MSQEEINFIKPLVDQAALVRKMKSFNVKKDFFLECLLDKDILDEMIEILNKLKKKVKENELYIKERNFDKFSKSEMELYDLSN